MTFAAGRPVLAIPGPSPVPDRVLRAMHRPAPDIYEGELVDLNAQVMADLKRLAGTRHFVAPYIGNGHGGWEAANTNLFSPGDRALVLAAGHFGRSWAGAARARGVEVEIMDFGNSAAPDPQRLSDRLGGPPAFRDGTAPEMLPLLQDHALQDYRDVVARAACPVLMVAGRDSQVWPCEHAAAAVADPASLAIVIGGSGNGEQIAANKVKGARAALAWSTETASLARQHNNAQVVSVGARMHTADEATAIVEAFLTTPWSDAARHQRRIDMLLAYEETGRFA